MNKKIAYLDCFSGISGDMFLGAIVDVGVPIEHIINSIRLINISGYEIVSYKVKRNGISATKVDVIIHNHKHQTIRWNDIEQIISSSGLENVIKTKALDIFREIFQAEAKVHGYSFEDVHLHELGGVDCIVDIVGAIIGLDYLNIGEVISSPINLGSDNVKTSHGLLPVPAPATVELLRGFTCYTSNIPLELTTPTGASLIKTLTRQGEFACNIQSIGYGAGSKEIPNQPNVLRLIIGEASSQPSDDCVYIVETNIDDMNPQYYEPLIDQLLNMGAKDVYLEQIVMKKSRPAIKMSVITDEGLLKRVVDTIFLNTTTIGIRYYKVFRNTLNRTIKYLDTEFGQFRIKESSKDGILIHQSIEFEDLLNAHKKYNMPLKRIERTVWETLKGMAKAKV